MTPKYSFSVGDRQALILIVAAMLATSPCLAQSSGGECGELTNGYGPYDYRKDRDKLGIVDSNHFTPQVEQLIRGISGPIGGELDYTLRAFPNHHRALIAMTRWSEKVKSDKPSGAHYSVDCYFDRALRFKSDDNVVRMLYAQYLGKQGRTDDAVRQLETAAAQAPDVGFTQYNIGLVYFEIGQHQRALTQAHRAIALGFDRPSLRAMLEKIGKWQDPPPAPAPSAPTETPK